MKNTLVGSLKTILNETEMKAKNSRAAYKIVDE